MNYLFKIVLFLIAKHASGSIPFPVEEFLTPTYIADKVHGFLESRSDLLDTSCGNQLITFGKALLNGEVWALKMIDASGKLASGILEGNVDMGSYDECISIDGSNSNGVMGQYCIGNILLELPKSSLAFSSFINAKNPVLNNSLDTKSDTVPIKIRQALCIPDACSHHLLNLFFGLMNIKTEFSKEYCQTKNNQYELDGGAIAAISVLTALFTVVFISTLYDYYNLYTQKESQYVVLSAFSIITNGRKLLRRNKNPETISCLHGMRVLSTVWIIMLHSYTLRSGYPVKNMLHVLEWIQLESSMIIFFASISVDTFFIIGGITLSYTYLLARQKGKKFNVLLFYIHRLFRITPVLVYVVIFYITLLKHMGSGPLWPQVVQTAVADCEENWWRTLLYINNYGDYLHCFRESWYLSMDMQLYLLSPIILIPLNIWPKLALAGTAVLTMCSMIACFVIGWEYDIKVQVINLHNLPASMHFMVKYYFPTHTRASVWLIGVLYGYIIYKVNDKNCKLLFHKAVVGLLWIVSLAVLCTCVFGGYGLVTTIEKTSKFENSIFLALVRPSWGIAVGWIALACFNGYGGPVNWFLSSAFFEVLGKLSFTLYMLHLTVLLTYIGHMRSPPFFSNSEQYYVLWGILGFSIIYAVIIHCVIECPFIAIEQWIFGEKKETAKKDVQEVTTNTNAVKEP